MAAQRKTKNYYSSHNFATRVSFGTQVSVHEGLHGSVVSLHGLFLRAVLPAKVEVSTLAVATDGKTKAFIFLPSW